MDYQALGLDDKLRAINSPAGGTISSVQSLEFESNYEVPSNGLTYDKVRSITADQISAGTINSTVVYAGTVSADKIGAGTISVGLNLGGANIIIDGAGKNIIVNDGTTDRILIGYGSGLF